MSVPDMAFMNIDVMQHVRLWQSRLEWTLGSLAKAKDPLRIHELRRHARVHYLLSTVLMVLYGVQVCPFIEELPAHEIWLPLCVCMGLAYASRQLLAAELRRYKPSTALLRRALICDFLLFQAAGLMYCAYNWSAYGFPLESTLKVLFGFLALGFFAAIDLALQREHCLALTLKQQHRQLPTDTPGMSLMKKAGLFISVSTTLSMVVLLLVFIKDLHWLSLDPARLSDNRALLAVTAEALFIALLMAGYQQRVVRSFNRNLGLNLHTQHATLSAARSGDFSQQALIASNDELGAIGREINHTLSVIQKQKDELQLTQDMTINALASLAEARDNETGMHIVRTQHYMRVLAQHLAQGPAHHHKLTPAYIDLLYKSAPLHDIGKVGIPDAILCKPGKLTDEEFTIMKQHATIGAEALQKAQSLLGKECSYLSVAMEIAQYHHEKWDGSGYPYGLKGDQIPLSARLMAVADVYDALISARVYKPAFSHEKAMAIIVEGRGAHFDPMVIDALLSQESAFKRIAATYQDEA